MNFRAPTIPPPGTSACIATPSHVPGEKAGQQSTPQLELDCCRAADSLSPRQIAIRKFNELYGFTLSENDAQPIPKMATYARLRGRTDLAAELERSLEK